MGEQSLTESKMWAHKVYPWGCLFVFKEQEVSQHALLNMWINSILYCLYLSHLFIYINCTRLFRELSG